MKTLYMITMRALKSESRHDYASSIADTTHVRMCFTEHDDLDAEQESSIEEYIVPVRGLRKILKEIKS